MNVLVFSHFDKHDIVDDYVMYALRCYRPYFDVIAFVSTSRLNAGERDKVRQLADMVIVRTNIGYDFGSWRVGYEAVASPACDSITFANDSVYGPCRDIAYMMQSCANTPADLWGASMNRQFHPHVQSFFMKFGRGLLRSPFATDFWSSIDVIGDKQELILQYEVGLSRSAEEQGFRVEGLVDLKEITRSNREWVLDENEPIKKNGQWEKMRDYIMNAPDPSPVQLFWGEMLRGGAPLVKIELFRENPMNANRAAIFRRIKRDKWYDASLMINHLSRVLTPGQFAEIQGAYNEVG